MRVSSSTARWLASTMPARRLGHWRIRPSSRRAMLTNLDTALDLVCRVIQLENAVNSMRLTLDYILKAIENGNATDRSTAKLFAALIARVSSLETATGNAREWSTYEA